MPIDKRLNKYNACLPFLLAANIAGTFNSPAALHADPFAISPLDTRVLGSTQWQPGARAALRIIVTNHMTHHPIRSRVRILLARVTSGR